MSVKQRSSVVAPSGSTEGEMSPYVRECLDKVALAEGFVNYEIDFNTSGTVGDGFIGVMFKAVIREIKSDKTLGVIVKSPPTSPERRVQFNVMELFEREVCAYTKVFPKFAQIQEENNIELEKRFTQFPKCYFAEFDSDRDDSIVIMEDLKERDFVMCDKAVPASFEHAKLVLTALGRLHALSFAFKTMKPEMFETFKQLKDLTAERLYNDNFMPSMLLLIDRAAASFEEGDVDSRQRVLKLKDDFKDTLIELCDSDGPEPFTVLGHGDCWLSNFMFKLENGEPTNIVMLDWQGHRYVSPALDIVHFLFVCTDSELRFKHYDELLRVYYNSLSELLNSLGGDAEKQFPFAALLDQLKKFGKFGVYLAVIMIPIMLTKTDDFPDLDDVAKEMKDFEKSFGANDDGYKKRMKDIIRDAVRYEYL